MRYFTNEIFTKTGKSLVSCAIIGLGVGMIIRYNHGVDPLSLFQLGISSHTNCSVGTIALIYNIILIILSFIVNRKKLGIGTVIYTFTLGFFMDLALAALPMLSEQQSIFAFFLGHFILCFGNASLLYLDFGLSSLDAIIQWWVAKSHIRYGFIKVGTDIFFSIIGIILGSQLKWGTLYIMITTGFIIDFIVQWFCKLSYTRNSGRKYS